MSDLDRVLTRIDSDFDASLDRLFDLLKIKSISTDPAFKGDCRAAADWLAAELSALGIASEVRDTTGHPMVVGHRRDEAAAGPHVLFYGHYDVQPVDPLDLWERDPFDPAVVTREDGSKIIVARGAADDKGQLMTFVEAARAWINETGGLPVPVTILLEGEEESGSPSLHPFLEANKDELSCDLALVCDTGMWDRNTPAITTMLRGLVGEEITITAANRDLHSGMFGGAARNPIHVLASILDGLHDETGRVTLPNFYDGVIDMPADVTALWEKLGFDHETFLGGVGLKNPPAKPTAPLSSTSGRGRPARSTASGADTTAPVSRRSFPRRPMRRFPSASSAIRIRTRFAWPSAPMCAKTCPQTARSASPSMAEAPRFASISTARRWPRAARRCPMNGSVKQP